MTAKSRNQRESHSQSQFDIEEVVLSCVEEELVVSLDRLAMLLPDYTWNQIFDTVDHLSRGKRIALRRHGRGYTLFSLQYAA